MKKMLNRGFTLVELIVVTMLMGTITTAVVMIIQPTRTIYNNVTSKSSEEDATIILTEYLNAELRYSSNLTIVCNDETDVSTILAADTDGTLSKSYDNFIMISNNTRSNSKKGARGYTEKGLLSNPSNTSACVLESLLDEFDYQFSIADYCTDEGNQSVTLGVVARTMVSDTTTFIPNPDFAYEYEEAFQLLNIQESIGGNTENFDVIGSNSTYSTIWIFYKDPESTASSSGSDTYDCNCCSSCTNKAGCTCGCSDCECPSDTTSFTIVQPDTSSTYVKLNVHVVNIASNTDHWSYSDVLVSTTASGYNGGQFVVGDYTFTMGSSGYVEFTETKDSSDTAGVTYTYSDIEAAGGTVEIWIWDGYVHTMSYADYLAADAGNQTLTLHIIATSDSDMSDVEVSYSNYMENGLVVDGTILGQWDTTTYDCSNGDYDLNIVFNSKSAKAYIKTYQWGSVLYTYEYGYDESVGDGTKELWLFRGSVYEDITSIPPSSTVTVNISDDFIDLLSSTGTPVYYVNGDWSTRTYSGSSLTIYSDTVLSSNVCGENNQYYPSYSFNIDGEYIYNNGYTVVTMTPSGVTYSN